MFYGRNFSSNREPPGWTSPQATYDFAWNLYRRVSPDVNPRNKLQLLYITCVTALQPEILHRSVPPDRAPSFSSCVPALNQQMTLSAYHSVLAEEIQRETSYSIPKRSQKNKCGMLPLGDTRQLRVKIVWNILEIYISTRIKKVAD